MLHIWNGAGPRGRLLFVAALLLFSIVALTLHIRPSVRSPPATSRPRVTRPLTSTKSMFNPDIPPVACRGPRGGLLNLFDSHDLPQGTPKLPGVSWPNVTTGSYESMGLEKSWMTIDDRYGPYGYGEEKEGYAYSKVDWVGVNWGKLQQDCWEANSARFGPARGLDRKGRFRHVSDDVSMEPPVKTGRQAVVLRTWSLYKYQPEDFWNIRSIIAEASLAGNGAYDVILLVDVKDKERGPSIIEDETLYREILEDSVPEEFQDMAVLFHTSLLEEWYAKVEESAPIWQIMQPLQLFAHFYPEYDHYWQFELDTRFTGDVGKMLRAFDDFGRQQPYKQSRERATWDYISELHGTYEEFSQAINKTLNGGASTWGPIDVGMAHPPVREPPLQDPHDDDFSIGVGSDADLLVMNTVSDVKRIERFEDWPFKDWVRGPVNPNPERFVTVPAQGRASWELLEAAHRAQHESGIAVPSEATLPTFALWNGLKLVYLPIPSFLYPTREIHELNLMLNGGFPRDFGDGMAYGPGHYRAHFAGWFHRPKTWDWWSSLCDGVMAHWMHEIPKQHLEEKDDPRHPLTPLERPGFMVEVDGEVYAPGFIMHPRKTNHNI